ncbi:MULTISPECIES: amidohydrolase family protein [unclassified Microbacterium]|uniref:amidohydrolase family protein n=1 Tax=Microbacterium sp. CIAB417 TaxID=2860287 RepID=UPI001FAC49F4|nr:amidohydrolase family protein [Microbacterium sp. CIAB417]
MTRRTIDVHAHIGRTVANGIGQSVDELIARMDRAGISEALPSPAAADRQVDGIADTRRMNDLVAAAVAEHPERFPAGLGLVEVRHEEHAVHELVRIIDDLGLAGISVHPTLEGYYLDTPLRVDPLWEVLDDRGALCLMHSSPDPGSGEAPAAVRSVVSRFPRVTTFLGHAFLTPDQKSASIEIVREFPHVYFDVAYQSDPAMTASLVEEVGSEKVVFGTDTPFFDSALVRQSVLDAEISEQAKDDVLYANVQRILDARH